MVFSQFSLLSYFHHVNCCLPPIKPDYVPVAYRQKHSLCFYVKPSIVAAALHLQGKLQESHRKVVESRKWCGCG